MKKNYNTYVATNINESQKIIQDNKIDVVITDLIMKNETGMNFFTR